MADPYQKSAGHLDFTDQFEFFERDGEVYRAKRSDPLADVINKSRHGRWECSKTAYVRFRKLFF